VVLGWGEGEYSGEGLVWFDAGKRSGGRGTGVVSSNVEGPRRKTQPVFLGSGLEGSAGRERTIGEGRQGEGTKFRWLHRVNWKECVRRRFGK